MLPLIIRQCFASGIAVDASHIFVLFHFINFDQAHLSCCGWMCAAACNAVCRFGIGGFRKLPDGHDGNRLVKSKYLAKRKLFCFFASIKIGDGNRQIIPDRLVGQHFCLMSHFQSHRRLILQCDVDGHVILPHMKTVIGSTKEPVEGA